MASFNIAIIQPNDYIPTVYDTEKLKHDLEDYIKIVKVSDTQEMMEVVIKSINLTTKQTGHTTKCFESERHMYDMCHTIQDKNYKGKDVNYIASRLVYGRLNIYGNSVFIKSKINTDGTCSTDNLTIDDITEIYRSKFVHKAVLINSDDKINEITYVSNPTERLTPKEIENIKGLEYQFLNYVIGMYIYLLPPNTITNKDASLISYKHVVGPVIVTLRTIDGDIIDITQELYTQIITVMKNGSYSRNFATDESVDPVRDKSGKQVISNFYTILSSRFCKCSKKNLNSEQYETTLKKIISQTPLNTIVAHKIAQQEEKKKS